jgi:ADP-heptose:LPS heptosyltransferase
MKSCGLCSDFVPQGALANTVQVLLGENNTGSLGIGDAMLALLAATGLARDKPEHDVFLVANAWQVPWLELFDSGVKVVTEEVLAEKTHRLVHQIAGKHEWPQQCGTTLVRPPLLPLSEDVLAWAAPYQGMIALAPFAMHAQREWLPSHWLRLEQLLLSSGRKCVIFGGPQDKERAAGFVSPGLFGEPPAHLAALLSQAKVLIGNDSGPMHLAGMMGVPGIVLLSQLLGEEIYGHYPSIRVLQGPLACSGCNFTGPEYRNACQSLCSSLQAITPEVVLKAVNEPQQPAREENVARFCLPTGIGDCVWALTKIRQIAGKRPIDVVLSGDPKNTVDHRTVPFLKRFPFIQRVSVKNVPMLVDYHKPTDEKGRYNYVPDGLRNGLHYLVPNAALEKGVRLEDWLTDVPIDWDIMAQFDWSGTERAASLAEVYAPFVAFYLGPLAGNTVEGHNRGPLWSPEEWLELGIAMKQRGMNVVVVGAEYDRSYWEDYVKPLVDRARLGWLDTLGKWEIGETLAFLRKAKCFVSYQCGLAMVTHYLGGRVACWWRPDGNTLNVHHLLSFDERFATGWVRLGSEKDYLGLIYQRASAVDVMHMIDERKWLA